MPICANCGSQQPDGAAFCNECGAKLEEVTPAAVPPAAAPPEPTPTAVATNCPVCGAPVIPGEAFCDNCGTSLAGVEPSDVANKVSVCPQCENHNLMGAAFCDNCGASLAKVKPSDVADKALVCPQCGNHNPMGAASSRPVLRYKTRRLTEKPDEMPAAAKLPRHSEIINRIQHIVGDFLAPFQRQSFSGMLIQMDNLTYYNEIPSPKTRKE